MKFTYRNKAGYFLLSSIVLSLTLLLITDFSCKTKTGKIHAIKAWNFPGNTQRRFPIVADNIINFLYNQNGERSIPSKDTIYYYLKKVYNANYTVAIIDLFPPGIYYENFLSALDKLNSENADKPLKILVYDGRIKKLDNESLKTLIQKYYDKSNIYGFFIDEPSQKEFDYLRELSNSFFHFDSTLFKSSKLYYINLFGISAFNDINDYVDYVNSWVTTASPAVLSFDNYALWNDSLASLKDYKLGTDWDKDYFLNLEVFRDVSLKYNIPFWTWIQVHQHWSDYSKRYYRRATPADIRYQVYSALAYGAKGILYYRFWNPDPKDVQNGWHEQKAILDFNGSETELYKPISELNSEILSFGDLLLNLKVLEFIM